MRTTTPAAPRAVSAPGAASAVPLRWYAHPFNRPGVYWLGAVGTVLPRTLRLWVAAAVGARLQAWFPVERAVVRANLARIAAERTAAEREALAEATFRHFAMCFADLLTTNRRERGPARAVSAVDGGHHLDDAVARGGAVLLTAHLGNWELAGRLLAERYEGPQPSERGEPRRGARPHPTVHVVVAPEADAGVERFLRGGAAPVRFVVRSRPTAVLPLIGALRRGELVAMQGDRALGDRNDVAVPFWGAEARFPLGPFVLARAADVPVLPVFCLLERDRRYRIRVGEPIVVPDRDASGALRTWVAAVEDAVGRHPEQWFNFFDVWGGPPAR